MRYESEHDLDQREADARRELDLAQMGRAVARRRYWIIAPVALCFLASLIGVNVVAPRYTAEAKILLENQENFFTRPDRSDQQTAQLPDEEAVQSQVQLVSSRDIARDAVKSLGLQGNPEFDPLAEGLGPITRLLVLLGLEQDPLRVSPEDRILASYYDKLTVFPVVKSRVLSVQFTSEDPDLAAKAANTISDLYIGLQSSAKRDSAHAAATSLAGLLADLRVRAAAAQTKAQEYRAQHGLLVGTNNTTITSQQLADISTQLAQARTAQADAEAKAKVLRDKIRANRISEVPDVANNDLVRRIADQRMTLQAQISQQAQTLLPGHPRMQEMTAQLAGLDAQMRAAAEKTVRTLENEAHIAAGRVDNLQSALDAQKQTASSAGANEVNLNELELQARLLKDQLEFNTQKYQEALARENAESTPADARIISRAMSPATPSFPKKGPMIAIFTLAGLLLSVGAVIGRELLSGRAFVGRVVPAAMPVQLEDEPLHGDDVAMAPVRVSLPAASLHSGAPRARTPMPESGLVAEFAALLSDIRSRRKDHASAVRVLVAAARSGIAVIPVALQLARALSRDERVILVDCGAEPGGLETTVSDPDLTSSEQPAKLGMRDLLAGQTTFAEVIHRDPMSRLHIVPLGSVTAEDNAEGFEMMVDALAETYDHVVLAVPVPKAGETALQGADRSDLAVLLLAADMPAAESDVTRATLYAAGVPEVIGLDAALVNAESESRSAA